jgi:trigger factor
MISKIEKTEKNVVKLEIELDAAEFEQGVQKAYKKNIMKYSVPGFRKGKAPKALIERYYGETIFYEDAVNILFPEFYDEAVRENDLHPVARPEMDIKQIGKDKNLIFEATVTVKPEVELGRYLAVEVEKADAMVTEEDVEKEIARIAETHSRMITIDDRPVKDGDIVKIDFEGFADGAPFEGGKGENYDLTIGSGQFIPGFEEQLIGRSVDEDIEVNVTFPEDYNAEELKGKPVLFKVKIHEIKMKEIPAIDDEFAKDASEFDTLDDYKNDVRAKLKETAEKKAKSKTENDVISKIIEESVIDLPQVMIENHIDRLVDDFARRIKYQGIEMDKYLELTGMDMPKMREQFRERADKEIRTQLVLEKIGEVEKVEVSDEDVEAEIALLAENYKQTAEELKKQLQPDDIEYISENIRTRNTVAMLVSKAVMK